MKRISTVILISLVVLLASCEKETFVKLGFDASIDKFSNGLVIVHISNEDQRFYLTGVISLFDGQAVVTLTNPDGVTVYSNTIVGPQELHINETFNGDSGYWKLQYISSNGVGEINLHIFK